MRFISPKTDFAFKKIFGSTDSKDILISFLNALIYGGKPTIHDLEIIAPLDSVPETMETITEIQKAFILANQANLSTEELENSEKREMFLEDQRGAIIKGRQVGILELIMRLLARQIGEISPEIQNHIRRLSIVQLENLGEAVLDFTSASDLTDWLQVQNNHTDN